MVSRAMDEKRPKYTLGKSRKKADKRLAQANAAGMKTANEKYSDSHWLNTYNDKQGARAYSLKSRQARRYMVSNYGSSRWLIIPSIHFIFKVVYSLSDWKYIFINIHLSF